MSSHKKGSPAQADGKAVGAGAASPTGIPVVHNDSAASTAGAAAGQPSAGAAAQAMSPMQAIYAEDWSDGTQPEAASTVQKSNASSSMEPPPPSGAPVVANGVKGATAAAVAATTAAAAVPATATAAAADAAAQGAPGDASGAASQDAPPPPPPPDGQPVLYGKQTSLKNGINKCPYCGSSDIQLNMDTGLLHCNFCRREFSEEADTIDGDISKLSGIHMGSGASDILYDASDVVTIKCSACGAEVVVDTNEAPQARCHWCRNMLSLNQQIPNGAVPDAIMPFRIPKEKARTLIDTFVGKRKFFAHPVFRREFTTENIMGVYLPYMVIDVNAHAHFAGQGEHEVRSYTVGSGNDKETRYDADLYQVGRDFDIYIDDLTVEASSDKLNQATSVNSNNIINAILPYPLKETVRFNANYIRGFTSEKRNVNREQILGLAAAQTRDVARYNAYMQSTYYDRGIRWDVEEVTVKGELWKTVYLPVWLYSYLQVKPNGKKFLHYVAVNACTGETMGSVPIHMPKLVITSVIVEIIGIILAVLLIFLLFISG